MSSKLVQGLQWATETRQRASRLCTRMSLGISKKSILLAAKGRLSEVEPEDAGSTAQVLEGPF